MLLNILQPAVTRENTRLHDCIAPEKVLALGLYSLARRNSYESIGPNFNVGRSTVLEAIQDVVEALFNLRNVYIKFPITEVETWVCIETFQGVSDLPNIVGTIVQAIVDGKKRFLDFASGFPGSMHYARVLRNSTIFDFAENDQILTSPVVRIRANEIKPYLAGDSAYPLACWLQKPFPEATRDPEEIAFNRALSAPRVAVECAFGMLKNRWQILGKRLDSRILCCPSQLLSIKSGRLE